MDRRQRTGYLVLSVVLGHVILISAQVNAQPGGTILQAVTFGVFTEVQRLLTSTRDGFVGFWSGYVGLRDVRQENEALDQEVARLSLELQQQRALAQQARSLERSLELRESIGFQTLSARVIATDATPYFRTLTIDRGRGDGVREDMAVVEPGGVVGRVVGVPGPRAAQVQLLIDRNAAAGALIERSRVSGVAVGIDGDGQLRMEYVSNLQDVRVGDRIMTSGIDGIYPEGFLIGRVTDAAEGLGLYQIIHVDPVVDFSNIEDVLVVMDAKSGPSDAAGE